jgi:hypothetical protein
MVFHHCFVVVDMEWFLVMVVDWGSWRLGSDYNTGRAEVGSL